MDGRLVLRGANGSGKSVTMQSFLPLVLDGDKRPWRLDPFGSRDRRIEYYLLLEPDSGITERTAYLWLEFYHQEQGKRQTQPTWNHRKIYRIISLKNTNGGRLFI